MLHVPLADIAESHLRALGNEQIPEGLELDFKETLDLSKEKLRREAAQDAVALANAIGGRLVYGVSEQTVGHGTVAGPITALTDPSIEERLANVLSTTITPRLRFQTKAVPVKTGGFVLILEVYSSATDLFMVTGYADNRYYRRGAKGNIPMAEPEVREAYERIASSKASIDSRLDSLIRSERELRASVDESIILVPWHGHASLLDPLAVPDLPRTVAQNVLSRSDWSRQAAPHLRLQGDGHRVSLPEKEPPATATYYLAILKTGLIHLSENAALNYTQQDQKKVTMNTALLVHRLTWALVAARFLYREAGYQGPVRLYYRLKADVSLGLDSGNYHWRYTSKEASAQTFEIPPIDFVFRELGGQIGPVVASVVHQVFHLIGEPTAPYFVDGHLHEKFWSWDTEVVAVLK